MNRFTCSTLALLLLGFASTASAFDCQILTDLPAEIDRPGKYCLDQSHDLALTANTPAIHILASDVDLDLRGHTLTNAAFEAGICNPSYAAEPTIGVLVYEARNVRIHDGALRCFFTGVQITQHRCGDCNRGNRVERLRVHQSGYVGIFAQGDFGVYVANQITDTGAVTDRRPRGIYVAGEGNTIRDNDIQLVWNEGAGISTGVGNNNLVVENRVQNADTGFLLFLGTEVRYRDNLTAATRQPYDGTATDLGNND